MGPSRPLVFNDIAGAKILCESSPYKIYELTKAIPTNEDWNKVEYDILKESVALKVYQNPGFKQQLLANSNKSFHEATYNRRYGSPSKTHEVAA